MHFLFWVRRLLVVLGPFRIAGKHGSGKQGWSNRGARMAAKNSVKHAGFEIYGGSVQKFSNGQWVPTLSIGKHYDSPKKMRDKQFTGIKYPKESYATSLEAQAAAEQAGADII